MTMMALTLAFLESLALYAAACTAIAAWAHHLSLGSMLVGGVAWQALLFLLCCAAAFYYNDLYDLDRVTNFSQFSSRLPRAALAASALAGISCAALPEARLPSGAFALCLGSMLAILLPVRALSYGILRSGPFRERVLILGCGPLAQEVIRQIEARPHLRYDIVGVAADGPGPRVAASRHPFLGPPDHLEWIIEQVRPDRIVVALSERRGRLPVSELAQVRLQGIVVEEAAEVYERLTCKLSLESLTPSSLVFGRGFGKSRAHLAIGRLMSLMASAAGLAVTAPLFPLIILAIKLESPGPAFFLQERVGLRGRRFRMIKFRTMRPASAESSAWEGDNEDRITRVGRLLRKFRLDEIPQFVNILRGDMNLVGPRPHPVCNYQLFVEKIPHYSLRTAVRPGVTGWAQIRYGYANNLEEETEKMRYDLYYIKRMTPLLDLRILFDTFKVVLRGQRRRAPRTSPAGAHERRPRQIHDSAA